MVRPARPTDAAALSALLAELGFPADETTTEQRLSILECAGETVLVAAVDDIPRGFASVHATPVLHRPTPVGRITALLVTSSMRGRGVGRALVQAAEDWSRQRGCALIEVTSNLRLTTAHAFYHHLGFETTSMRFAKSLAGGGTTGDGGLTTGDGRRTTPSG